MKLALFDLDNTLLSGDTDFEWLAFLIEEGVLPASAMRENEEPHRLCSASGTTGTGCVRRIFITPPLKGCSSPSRVIAPSGKMASRSPSRSTSCAFANAAS